MVRPQPAVKPIHIVGKKSHGKTTLVVELVEQLSQRGLRVGTIKHSSHQHELDTPGKDSYRQRMAGARPVAVVSAELIGLYVPREQDADFYDQLAPMFARCDLVLVEGHVEGPGIKIEVWRRVLGGPPLAATRRDIAAVVSDDQPQVEVPVWPRSDLVQLAEHLLNLR